MTKLLQVGDRVRVTNNLTWEYFYPDNSGGIDGNKTLIPLGEVGLVKEINIKDGVVYDEVCVSFSGDGGLGCWYIHKAHLELVS